MIVQCSPSEIQTREFLEIASFPIDIDDENAEGQEENTRDNDNDNLMREEDVLSDDEDEEDYQESIGSVDEDMAAALEQEFLGKQFIAFSSKNERNDEKLVRVAGIWERK